MDDELDEGPENPIAKGNCLAQTFFCWLLPLFGYGYKNPLEIQDLHRVCPQDSSGLLAEKLEREWQKELEELENVGKKPSLLWALIRTFGVRFALCGIIILFEECICKLLSPILLSLLLSYFSPVPAITRTQAYLCAAGMVACAIGMAIAHHPYFFNLQRIGMQIRVAVSALVFRKSLRLSNAALGQTTVGKLVNILSSDVSRFDMVTMFLHYMWIGPLQLLIILVILFHNMGPSCLVGVIILVMLLPPQAWTGKLFSKFRNKTALLTDERVRIMNEIISGMRVIKIHAWEKPFSELIKLARKKEIRKILHSSYLRAFNLAFFGMSTTFISYATFTVYAYSGHVLTPGIVFLVIPLFNIVRLTVVLFIPYCIMYTSEGVIAIKRIQGFLMMEELKLLKRSTSMSSIASDANLPVPEQIGEPLDDLENKEEEEEEVADGDCRIDGLSDTKQGLTDGKVGLTNGPEKLSNGPGRLTDEGDRLAADTNGSTDGTNELINGHDGLIDGTNGLTNGHDGLVDDSPGLTEGTNGLTHDNDGLSDGNVEVGFLPNHDEMDSGKRHSINYMGLEEEEDNNKDVKNEAKINSRREENHKSVNISEAVKKLLNHGKGHHKVIMKGVTGSWDMAGGQGFTLRDISLNVKAGELVAVIGPVGCGKSSLLMAIMNELPNQTGEVILSGSLGYTAQQPWVFSGTLRDNILFGNEFEVKKYKKVISACALTADISVLPDGDLTMVGDRGITLSGGQRARVSLARAVYHDADVYLLDDPLSAVDTAVGRHLFDKCITGYLRKKPVLLVTHQLQYLTAAERIMVLMEGNVTAFGTYEELQNSGIDFTALLKEYEAEVEMKHASAVASACMSRSSSILSIPGSVASEMSATDDLKFEEDRIGSDRFKEKKQTGSIGYQVYTTFLLAGAGVFGFLVFAIVNFAAQAFMVLTDWWLAQWAYAEQTACGELFNGSCTINTVQANHTFVDELGVDRTYYLNFYSIFLCCFIVTSFSRTYHIFFIIVNASRKLHNKMFAAIVRAPMRFFDTNPIGQVLNRFSKDLSFMDEMLPSTAADFNSITMQAIGVIITIGIFNPIVFIFTIPLCIVFVFVRRYYLATSRDVKRLEGIARSPVFSHLSATLQGLVTIRSFGVQRNFMRQFDGHQNTHTRTWVVFLSTTRWFGIMMEWLTVSFLAVVAFSCIFTADLFELNSSLVGLSLTYSIMLMGTLQVGVRQSAEIENLMTSTERVLEYTRLESEGPLESDGKNIPPKDWPQHGIITFEDVSVSYSEDGPLVLKNLRCCFRASEKVGVVGRTGAGKSSLMGALMRLTEPKGILKIDEVQITDIGLHDLRKRISFIPQDPVLFSGTMRKNLDPFSEHTDDQIWNALEEVQLKSLIEENAEQLEMRMSEGGLNFSVGQRQLVCLARAVLHKNKILIVDEATANVDPRTDRLIQLTIRKKFKGCTVLTIAHRLNTIMDSDRVLVLEAGRIAEFDEPFVLLNKEKSLFTTMVAEAGKAEAAKLFVIARQQYFEANPSNPYDFDPKLAWDSS